MKMSHLTLAVCGLLLASLGGHPVWANVFNMDTGLTSLEMVTVGDPGNMADTRVMANDRTTGYGSVSHTYQIGKYDVTAGQYCQFLNAVATVADPYGLYNSNMAVINTTLTPWPGCGITRSGSSGNYAYSVRPGRGNFPVNYVSWGAAARFCNWLSNGQGAGNTEVGSYALNGATSKADLAAVTRLPNATYVIPNEDEWYKAAYYKGGGTDTGYWLYPTWSNDIPSNLVSTTGTNNANYTFWNGTDWVYADKTNLLTQVGAYPSSTGPYGTLDQGGDLFQWNETVLYGGHGIRGGSCEDSSADVLRADYRSYFAASGLPVDSDSSIGFRVALVPEPATLSLLALGGLLYARRRRA